MDTASDTEYAAIVCGCVCAKGSMSSGSTSTGLYLSFALVTAFRPCDPAGRYESRFTHANASRCACTARAVRAVVRLAGRTPSSSYRLMPCFSARVSTNGQSKKSPLYVT